MTKQRTDNLGLILLDDHDEDSFYADHIENLGKINEADKAQTAARVQGDAATLAAAQAYVDVLIQGRAIRSPVRAAATSNITLSGTQTVDGVVLAVGDSAGAFGQTNGAQNGVYLVHTSPWTRRPDLDASSEFVSGMFVWSTEGTANADSLWELKNDGAIVLGTTALIFEAKAGKAAGLALSSDLTAEIAARTSGDSGLQTALTAETNARTTADTTLQTNINNEATARASGDSTNASAIAAKIAARQAMITGGKLDPSLMPALAPGQLMALMGDSIIAQNNLPGGNTTNGLTYTNDACSWWMWAQIALGIASIGRSTRRLAGRRQLKSSTRSCRPF